MSKPMTFKDLAGREWNCELKYSDLAAIKETSGIDLPGAVFDHGPFLAKLMEDGEFVVRLLVAITLKAREAAEVSEQDFLNSLSGQILDDAAPVILYGIGAALPKGQRVKFDLFAEKLPGAIDEGAKRVSEQFEAELKRLGLR